MSATFLTLNAAVRTRITRAVAFAAEIAVPGVSRVQRISRVIQASRISGTALLAVGVVMLYGLVTPLLIGVGAAVVAYASHILSLLRRRPRNQRRPAGQENGMASPAYEETGGALPRGQTFRYRYRGLRLLIMGQGRMFLVPAQWDPSDSALIVPPDGSVRVQFQFENQPP